VDVTAGGRSCRLVWTNPSVAAPTVVPKLSLTTGLVYAYTKTTAVTDPWYWTAIDFRTGKVVWRALAGSGIGFNNNYAGITLGPDGTAYLGTLGGIIAMRDGRP
jgi:outer membrane protein assembly factor BamB